MNFTREGCFTNLPQYYLVCVTIHKAKDLQVLNADTYVSITLDKKTKHTATFKNSDCPFFNEYFVFEHYCSLAELLRFNVSLVLFKKNCAKKDTRIGEITIDLNVVWSLENHSFHNKWGVLENNNTPGLSNSDDSKAYLQFDLSIISKDAHPKPVVFQVRDYDNVESNLLQPLTTTDALQRVKYVVNIHRGDFIRNGNYAVQISFAANVLRTTKVIKNSKTPEWNEQFCFPGNFPSLCQTIPIQVMINDICSWNCYAVAEIHLDEICDDGYGLGRLVSIVEIPINKKSTPAILVHYPSIGPTHIQLYDVTNRNQYLGRLLLAIDTDTVDTDIPKKPKINVIPSLLEVEYWSTELFQVRMIVFNVSRVIGSTNKLKIQFHLGAQSSNIVDYPLCEYNKGSKNFFTLTPTTYPLMSVSLQMPDNRLKFQIQFSLNSILDKMKAHSKNFKLWTLSHPKAVKQQCKFAKKIMHDAIETLMNFCGNLYYKIFKRLTQWDKNRLAFLQAFIEENITSLEKLKKVLNHNSNPSEYLHEFETKFDKLTMNISSILANSLQDKWPDLIIEMQGNNEMNLFYRTDSRMFCFSQNKCSMGRYCGKRHDIILKPIDCLHTCTNCGCYSASASVSMWIGTNQDKVDALPDDCVKAENGQVSSTAEGLFKCNIYVHQAKIRPGLHADAKIVATLNDMQGVTSIIHNTLSPLWNEVITFNCVKLIGSASSYGTEPPIVFLDVYDFDGRKKHPKELLCTAILRPSTKLLDLTESAFPSYSSKAMSECTELIDSSRNSTRSDQKRKRESMKTNPVKHVIDFMDRKKSKKKLLDFRETIFPTPLQWVEAVKDCELRAEILCSAELIQLPGKTIPIESVTNQVGIPSEICPVMANYKVEVTFAGLRHCKHLPLRTMGRYKMEMSFAELNLKSGPSSKRYGDSVNFLDPFRTGYVSLPEEQTYWPPIIIKHLDCSSKKEIAIGATIFSNTEKFLENQIDHPKTIIEIHSTEPDQDDGTELDHLLIDPIVKQPGSKLSRLSRFRMKACSSDMTSFPKASGREVVEKQFTWWTKFYNSMNHEHNGGTEKHHLTILDCELEKCVEFGNLTDWAEPMMLVRATNSKKSSGPKDIMYGTLKCSIRVTKTSGGDGKRAFINLKNDRLVELTSLITETNIVVRIYIVQGINLRSKDVSGITDSYLRIEYGNDKITDRAHYVPNQANPIFGKKFQVNGILPKDTELKISIYDYDNCCLYDNLIGCTVIDVEDRIRSRHRAYCGLAEEYNSCGYNFWRDPYRPSEILRQICHKYDLGEPSYIGNKIVVAGITFKDTTRLPSSESKQERLCLSVLKDLDRIPDVGFKLVPEHVETRSLYRSDRPGVEQGKLQLWIEIFDPDRIPEPIDLTPSPPRAYELRVIIWNTSDVILDEKNIFGKYMSDIYVKGWLSDVENAQYTDIHYRSVTGDGNFNWRMVFPLLYSESEDMMVVRKKKSIYDKFDTEIKLPTNLHMQIWDNDSLSADDFLGLVTINISNIQSPAETAAKCVLNPKKKYLNFFEMDRVHKCTTKHINLFEDEQVRGWFPVKGVMKNGRLGQTGKIELEIQVLLAEIANNDPVGKGREGPHALPPPNRPDSSFNWLTSPIRLTKCFIKYTAGKSKQLICCCCSIIMAIVLLVLLYYILPGDVLGAKTWINEYEGSSERNE